MWFVKCDKHLIVSLSVCSEMLSVCKRSHVCVEEKSRDVVHMQEKSRDLTEVATFCICHEKSHDFVYVRSQGKSLMFVCMCHEFCRTKSVCVTSFVYTSHMIFMQVTRWFWFFSLALYKVLVHQALYSQSLLLSSSPTSSILSFHSSHHHIPIIHSSHHHIPIITYKQVPFHSSHHHVPTSSSPQNTFLQIIWSKISAKHFLLCDQIIWNLLLITHLRE